jgi:sulfate adenylyltransferase large subunit
MMHTSRDAGLLRLITCGSVDDGKSTLIGRLLLDSKGVYQDQLEAVKRTSAARGDQKVDLSLLTDGLRAEREQGITIDVAYRYFSTPKRKFILGDTPGHVQYTRNMATAASTADAAIVLIDARHGVVEQTRRHTCLVSLLGVPTVIVCVNKMDLVGFDQGVFERIKADYQQMASSANPDGHGTIAERCSIVFLPISALDGDNVVTRSSRMAWHDGPALMDVLESAPDKSSLDGKPARFPVQMVIRPQDEKFHDYRGYAGQIASGTLHVGDEIVALPGGQRSKIARMHVGEKPVQSARAPESIAIELADDLDISRGDLIVHVANAPADNGAERSGSPRIARDVEATIVWMASSPLVAGKRVIIKHTSKSVQGVIKSLGRKLNIQTLALDGEAMQLGLNEIGRATVRLASPLTVDAYGACRATGAFIIIDEQSNNTVGAGLID